MTTDLDFNRLAAAWLADGPEELSDRVLDAVVDEIHVTRQRHAMRVPWRFPTMSLPVRVAALVVAGAIAIAGVMAIGGVGSRTGPAPTILPSAVPPPSAALVPTLGATFTSPWHGYSVRYPSGWTVTPATRAWAPGTPAGWGDPAVDELRGTDARLVATQQVYAAGQTPGQWLQAYCDLHALSGCTSTAGWQQIHVAGYPAYVDVDGTAAPPGSVAVDGREFEAVVTLPDRAYVFTMDGRLDRNVFDAVLGSIVLTPGDAVDMPPLTGRFTSPLYGYSIGTVPAWTVVPATERWRSTIPDSAFMDGLDVASDVSVGAMSQPLGGRTFDQFLAAFYQRQHATLSGSGCDDGGDPSTWPTIPIGDQTGRLEIVCSPASDEALVAVGDRVYLFELGHGNRSFTLSAFKLLLETVRFDPASAR